MINYPEYIITKISDKKLFQSIVDENYNYEDVKLKIKLQINKLLLL